MPGFLHIFQKDNQGNGRGILDQLYVLPIATQRYHVTIDLTAVLLIIIFMLIMILKKIYK